MSNTTYLITGANKGIGRGIVQSLLQRAQTTVVAGVRQPSDPTSASLNDLPVAAGSRLVVLQLREPADFGTLVARLADLSIDHLDVVIANAGSSTGIEKTLLQTAAEDVINDCTVNSAGPLRLFQSTWPLLEAGVAKRKEEKAVATRFILVSSTMGSIGVLDQQNMPVGLSYSMSKAAANYFAKKASLDFKDKGLVVGVLHPGWVQTSMGQSLADSIGAKEPPMTLDESIRRILKLVDDWTMDKTGKFFHCSGEELPW